MSIEADIKGRFDNEFEKLMVNVLFTGSWLHHAEAARLKVHSLTPEQYNVMRILRGSHPRALMLIDITSRMIDKNSNCTRLVEKLRQKGLVTRQLSAEDRRQVDISITEKGLALLATIDHEKKQWLATLSNLSRTEAQQLNRLLDKLRG